MWPVPWRSLRLRDFIYLCWGWQRTTGTEQELWSTGTPVLACTRKWSLREDRCFLNTWGQVQEEVHRFAIEYHRKVRGKNAQRSVLDEIKGIGPVRKKALLEHFKSIDAIRDASPEELEKAPGMNKASAAKVHEYFHPGARD